MGNYCWTIIWLVLLLQLTYGGAQFCPGVLDNFTVEDVVDTREFVALPSDEINFTEWIFPNSLRFTCSGQVLGWRFRAVSVDLDNIEPLRLPQWTIYHDNIFTPSTADCTVRSRSGSREELREIASGLYEYVLSSPVDVESGDSLGLSYDYLAEGPPLQLLFEDRGNETDAPVSYRRPVTGSRIFDTAGSSVTADTRFMPLVSVIVADPPTTVMKTPTATPTPSSSTSTVEPTPSPIPPVTTIPETTTAPAASTMMETTIITTAATATTAEFAVTADFTSTEPSNTRLDPTDIDTTEILATEPFSSEQGVAPTTKIKSDIIIGVVVGLLCVVLVMVLVAALILLLVKRRHRFKVPASHQVSTNGQDDPIYAYPAGFTHHSAANGGGDTMLVQANEAYIGLTTHSITMETNEAYGSTQCISTQDCSTTPSIPTEANEAYDTTPRILMHWTSPHPGDSPDKDGEQDYSNMDYDYVIP